MAGKLRKGFTTYLMILVIAVVAAFLICVTVMLFQPFRNILGFKYFYYNDEIYAYTISDSTQFDFSSVKEINVDCNYASISVESTNEVDKHAIKFTNKAKGFAQEGQNTDFDYALSWKDESKEVLNITVHEPEGFLHLSSEVKISIFVPKDKDSSYGFENTKINLTNSTGNIYIGAISKDYKVINVNSLNVNTVSGNLLVYETADTTFDNLFIHSNSGNVEFRNDVKVTNSFDIYSESADFNFKNITAPNLNLDIAHAKFEAGTITGKINLLIKSGYLDIDKVAGSIVSNDANAQMESATISLGEVTGAVSFPFVNSSRIDIGTLGSNSQFYACATSGSINITQTKGKVYAETTSGAVNITTQANDIQVKTTSGTMNINYDSNTIANQLDFTSETGKINLKVRNDLAFVLVARDTEGNLREKGVKVEWLGDKFANPLTINGGSSQIVFISNADISVSLLITD